MKKKIFRSLTIVTLLSTFLFNIFIAIFMYNKLLEQEIANLKNENNYILKTIDENFNINFFKNFTSQNRITLINNDGTVIFDNFEDATKMDNHLDRTEVILAIDKGLGEHTRLSATLGEQTYYYAVRLNSGQILRTSFTTSSIFSIFFNSMPVFMSISLVFIFLMMYLSKIMTEAIIKPIYPENPDIYDELLPFVKKIDSQKQYIDEQTDILQQKIIEFDVISKNIADGLILLDSNSNILSINAQAVNILGNSQIDYFSKPFIDLTRIISIRESVKETFLGKYSDNIIEIHGKFFSFRFSPIINDEKVLGVVILIVDNTEKIQAEKIRREFSANVSHELKTPLTSISGYAELIKTGIVKPCDIVPFAENIYNETSYLIDLIEDIIKLSKLDEGVGNFEFSPVNLKIILENIISRLENTALQSNITISHNLINAEILAIKNVIQEIFYNLIENSIKYNKAFGSICIDMSQNDDIVEILIKDTGIGIPNSSINRIFERFYRADTSHSSEISGSGLGLSIVKNGIYLHKGTIDVSSEENIGTVFKISFNIQK